MKREKNFNKIGKKLPYQVPPEFFNLITEKTLQNAKIRSRKSNRKQLVIWISVAASLIVILLFSGLILNRLPEIQKTESMVQNNEKLMQTDREAIGDPANTSEFRSVENEQESVSENNSEYRDETFENLLATLTEEELQTLAGQISAEIFFNELIDE